MTTTFPAGDAVSSPSHLSAAQRARLRQLLVEERSVQCSRLSGLEHSGELGADLTAVLIGRSRRALDRIDEALGLLERGVYGTCVACGVPIPFERLEAMVAPYCDTCPAA